MENSKQTKRILYLCDLERFSIPTLRNTVDLAKLLDAQIEMFYVKKVTDLAKADNQLSVMREMSRDFIDSENQFKEVISSFSEEVQKLISYKIGYGNLKQEIAREIKMVKPDVIVLGKRKPKAISFAGDGLTEFVYNQHEGDIVISTDHSDIISDDEISLGTLNLHKDHFNETLGEVLLMKSKQPIKRFNTIASATNDSFSGNSNLEDVVFNFEEKPDLITNIAKYILLNNINLLFIERNKFHGSSSGSGSSFAMNNLLDNLNVSLWISKRSVNTVQH